MNIYVDNGESVKIYQVKAKVAKAVMTLLETDDNLACSETHEMVSQVANGTPLPKEHGRLIDADSLLNKFDETYKSKIGLVPDCLAEGFMQCEFLIKNEPTVYEGVKNENRD